jgi:hypothetical protein
MSVAVSQHKNFVGGEWVATEAAAWRCFAADQEACVGRREGQL